MTTSIPKRLHPRCVDAIEEIQSLFKKDRGLEVSFTECSRILGDKYFECDLHFLGYTSVERRWKKEGKLKRFKRRGEI